MSQQLATVLRPATSALSRRHGSGTTGGLDLGGIIAAVPTPFKEDGNVDYDALAANIKRWEQIPLRGASDFTVFTTEIIVDFSAAEGRRADKTFSSFAWFPVAYLHTALRLAPGSALTVSFISLVPFSLSVHNFVLGAAKHFITLHPRKNILAFKYDSDDGITNRISS